MHAIAYVVALACTAAAILIAVFPLSALPLIPRGRPIAFWFLLVAAIALAA